MKKVLISIVCMLCMLTCFNIVNIKAEETTSEDTSSENFTTIDENGDIVEIDIEKLEAWTKEEMAEDEALQNTENVGGASVITYGVVNFKTKSSAAYNTSYTEVSTGREGYTNGYYGADAAFLGYNTAGTKVKFMQSGVIGWVSTSEVKVINEATTDVNVSYYKVYNGYIYHNVSLDLYNKYYPASTMVGKKQSYMSNGDIYYSYDGHYFYKYYETMLKDYKNGVRTNSINPDKPYYNYYQYLSHRSKTRFTAAELNKYVTTHATSSVMKGSGSSFISNQNTYGCNAALMFGVACNESSYGTSTIAKTKYNLFGHAAYDSSTGSATTYQSVSACIKDHAKSYISEGYCDPKDAYDRYYGSHLGDKASGMNVRYASDPYWGEKAAAVCWGLELQRESLYPDYYKDYTKYTIGIKETKTSVAVRSDASISSTTLYSSGKSTYMPYIVLSYTTSDGETIYKVQSDATLNSDRSAITQDVGTYNFSNYYGYARAKYINIVANSSKLKEEPEEETTTTTSELNSSNTTITLSKTSYTYSGSACMPSVTVTYNSETLVKGTDYSVSYTNNINAGSATVSITGKGNYSGSISESFTINKKSISSNVTCTLPYASYYYKAAVITPTTTVKLSDGTKLIKGTDYTVKYTNNINVGTATITITGKGNYSDSFTRTFTIKQKTLDENVTCSTKYTTYTYTGNYIKPVVTVTLSNGNTLVKDSDYTVSYKNNKNVGIATITIKGKNNCSGTITKQFKIRPVKTSITSLTKVTSKKFKVKWTKKTTQVSGYQIQYSRYSDMDYYLIKTVSGNSNYYANISTNFTGKYYVRVRTYKIVNGTKYYSAWSSIQSIKV